MPYKFSYEEEEYEVVNPLDVFDLPVGAMKAELVREGTVSEDDVDAMEERDVEGRFTAMLKQMGAFVEPEPPKPEKAAPSPEKQEQRKTRREKRKQLLMGDSRKLLFVPDLVVKGYKCKDGDTIAVLAEKGITKAILQRLIWTGQVRIASEEDYAGELRLWKKIGPKLKVVDPDQEERRRKGLEAAAQLLRESGYEVNLEL